MSGCAGGRLLGRKLGGAGALLLARQTVAPPSMRQGTGRGLVLKGVGFSGVRHSHSGPFGTGEDYAREERERMLKRMTNAALQDLCNEHKVEVELSVGRRVPLKHDLVEALLAADTTYAHPERPTGPAAVAAPRVLTSEALGVGGLELEVAQLQTRVWLPHVAPAEVSARLDVSPPLGILLHGPPGCGKSLLAVRLARCLSQRPPRIVKGPELKSSLWGQDEQKIRGLFEAAPGRNEFGDALHVVILDEAEALLGSRRGEGGGGTAEVLNNSIVTQFLSCMDGAAKRLEEARAGEGAKRPERRLVIAITNRLDMLDKALLRPGRFEVQIEINQPSEAGRRRILELEVAAVQNRGALEASARGFLPRLAALTTAFSGADLAGLLREAKSRALARALEPAGPSSTQLGGPGAGRAAPGGDAGGGRAGDGADEMAPMRSARGESPASMLLKSDLVEALVSELARRERRGEPCVPVDWAREERGGAGEPP